MASHAKSSTISMILFRNVSLSTGKSTTRFGRSPFFRRKVTIFIGCETKTHILHTKINEKFAKVSSSNNNYSFRKIFHSTATTTKKKHNLERLRFIRRGASTPFWGVEACSPPSRRPNPIPAMPPYVVRTPHLPGAPTTEETYFVKP